MGHFLVYNPEGELIWEGEGEMLVDCKSDTADVMGPSGYMNKIMTSQEFKISFKYPSPPMNTITIPSSTPTPTVKVEDERLAEILEDAADRLLTDGWTQGTEHRPKGGVPHEKHMTVTGEYIYSATDIKNSHQLQEYINVLKDAKVEDMMALDETHVWEDMGYIKDE